MEDLNQLKIVLVKKKRTSKWLAEQLGVNQTAGHQRISEIDDELGECHFKIGCGCRNQ